MRNSNRLREARRRGVVAVVPNGGKLLVIRRSEFVEAPGAYCFPGGAIEQGETESAALRRELREELGLTIEPVRRLWRSVTSWEVELSWWLATCSLDQPLVPEPREVEAVHWMTPDELRTLEGLLESNRCFLQELRLGTIRLDDEHG